MSKIIAYLSEVKTELQKVTWPSKDTTLNLTWLVMGVSLVVALYLGLLDMIFQYLAKLIIKI